MKAHQNFRPEPNRPTPSSMQKKPATEKNWVMEHRWIDAKQKAKNWFGRNEEMNVWIKTFLYGKFLSPEHCAQEMSKTLRSSTSDEMSESYHIGREFRVRNLKTGEMASIRINKKEVTHGKTR